MDVLVLVAARAASRAAPLAAVDTGDHHAPPGSSSRRVSGQSPPAISWCCIIISHKTAGSTVKRRTLGAVAPVVFVGFGQLRKGRTVNAMPRLLILEALTDIAGGQSVLIDVLPALISTYQVGAIVPGDGALQRALQASDVVVFHAPMADYQLIKKSRADWLRFVVETPRLALTALRLIGQFNADLVYGNNSRTLVWGTLAASLARRPMMWHIHNIFGDRKTLRLLAVMSQLGAVKRIVCASTPAASQFKAAGKIGRA